MSIAPSASYSLTVRLEIRQRPGMLGRVTSAIGAAGGDIGPEAALPVMEGKAMLFKEFAGIVKRMASRPVVFAMANPIPEIQPESAMCRIPSVFNKKVAPAVARAVARAAQQTGVSRQRRRIGIPDYS